MLINHNKITDKMLFNMVQVDCFLLPFSSYMQKIEKVCMYVNKIKSIQLYISVH